EIVIGAIEHGRHFLEQRHDLIDEFTRVLVLAGGSLLNLLAVFVGAGQKSHVIAIEPLEAGKCVGGQNLVGVAAVGWANGVGYGGRCVELSCVAHDSKFSKNHATLAASSRTERSWSMVWRRSRLRVYAI